MVVYGSDGRWFRWATMGPADGRRWYTAVYGADGRSSAGVISRWGTHRRLWGRWAPIGADGVFDETGAGVAEVRGLEFWT